MDMHCLFRQNHNVKKPKLGNVDLHANGEEVWTGADGKHRFSTVPQGTLDGFDRQTFEARVTRLAGVWAGHNRWRIAAEEAVKARTERAREKAAAL